VRQLQRCTAEAEKVIADENVSPGRGGTKSNNDVIRFRQGNSSDYLLRRLARDRPEILAAYERLQAPLSGLRAAGGANRTSRTQRASVGCWPSTGCSPSSRCSCGGGGIRFIERAASDGLMSKYVDIYRHPTRLPRQASPSRWSRAGAAISLPIRSMTTANASSTRRTRRRLLHQILIRSGRSVAYATAIRPSRCAGPIRDFPE